MAEPGWTMWMVSHFHYDPVWWNTQGQFAESRLSLPDEDPATLDEFARSGITDADDIRDVFTRSYHFGCEADDPMTALAFDPRRTGGGRLKALFASDIGHWDVPDIREVLPEAW